VFLALDVSKVLFGALFGVGLMYHDNCTHVFVGPDFDEYLVVGL
jgi:hypothetical protein